MKFAHVLIASRFRSLQIVCSRVTDHAILVQNVTFVNRESQGVGKFAIGSGKFANFPRGVTTSPCLRVCEFLIQNYYKYAK